MNPGRHSGLAATHALTLRAAVTRAPLRQRDLRQTSNHLLVKRSIRSDACVGRSWGCLLGQPLIEGGNTPEEGVTLQLMNCGSSLAVAQHPLHSCHRHRRDVPGPHAAAFQAELERAPALPGNGKLRPEHRPYLHHLPVQAPQLLPVEHHHEIVVLHGRGGGEYQGIPSAGFPRSEPHSEVLGGVGYLHPQDRLRHQLQRVPPRLVVVQRHFTETPGAVEGLVHDASHGPDIRHSLVLALEHLRGGKACCS
mmetsp:Transcript_41595/g.109561  ORF Transcript_41595/g.109561 Transcript_41595/m.109561 type:complete len:251 (-) Transcript_41595:822-1574(-)